MVITHYGHSYFKLTLGDLTIAINPPSKASKPARFGADIALITTHLPETNDPETVTLGDKEPFVIDGPGSYESRELFFTGAPSKVTIKGKEYINTVYGFELDNIKIGLMGVMDDETTLSKEAKELLGNADMIFVPVGGVGMFDPGTAYKVANSYSPNVIIPYGYEASDLNKFLKEGGQDKVQPADKATLKRRDLDGKQGQIIIIESAA
jgi:hypothetical protein